MSHRVWFSRAHTIPASCFVLIGLAGVLFLSMPPALHAQLAQFIGATQQYVSPNIYTGGCGASAQNCDASHARTVSKSAVGKANPAPAGNGFSVGNNYAADAVVDQFGTIYAADPINGLVHVISADAEGLLEAGVSATPATLANYGGPGESVFTYDISCSGTLIQPWALAIDATGVLYIADREAGEVFSISVPSPQAYQTLAASPNTCSTAVMTALANAEITLTSPGGVAVDEYGSLYISDFGVEGTSGQIVWIPNYETYGGTPAVLSNQSNPVSPSGGPTGVLNPDHISWSPLTDRLYIADWGNNRIVDYDPYPIWSGPWNGTETIWSNGFSQTLTNPTAAVMDGVGNIYISEEGNVFYGSGSIPSQVFVAPAASPSTGYVVNVTGWSPYWGSSSPLSLAEGVTVDAYGSLYIADTFTGTGLYMQAGANTGGEVGYSVNMGHQPLNYQVLEDSPDYATLVFNVPPGVVVGPGSPVVVTTEGVANLDFTLVSKPQNINGYPTPYTTCYPTFTYAAWNGGYCEVTVQFTALKPGLRRGAVTIYGYFEGDPILTPIASAPLFGMGVAPEIEFFPAGYGAAVATTVPTSAPVQVALDGGNNLYVGNASPTATGGSVVEMPEQGGSGSAIYPTSSFTYYGMDDIPFQLTLGDVSGVAIDGAGNLFIADSIGTITGFEEFNTNMWVVSHGEWIPLIICSVRNNCDSFVTLKTPMAMAFDPAGNLFIADAGNNQVVEVSALQRDVECPGSIYGCFIGYGATVNTRGYNWSNDEGANNPSVTGVAVDPYEDILIADSQNGALVVTNQLMPSIYPGDWCDNDQTCVAWPIYGPYYDDAAKSGVKVSAKGHAITKPTSNFKSNQACVGTECYDPYFLYPTGVASDGFGNWYIADTGELNPVTGQLVGRITAIANPTLTNYSGGTVFVDSIPSIATTLGGGLTGSNIIGMAVDPQGNIFIPDSLNNRIVEFSPEVAPTLNFPSETIGSTTDYPMPIVVVNAGDEVMYFIAPASISPPFGEDNTVEGSCTPTLTATDGVLPAGAECYETADFTPASPGSVVGTLSFTDDSLWPIMETVTQTMPLIFNSQTGTGAYDFTISALNPASATVNPGTAVSIPYVITISPVNSATFGSPITLTVSGAPAGWVTLSPTFISASSGATSVMMTLNVPSLTSNNHKESLGSKLAPISFALLLLPLLGIRRARKAWRRYLTILVLLLGGLAATTGLSGCSSTPSGYFGTSGVTYDYNVTVTATSAAGVTHSSPAFLLTVN